MPVPLDDLALLARCAPATDARTIGKVGHITPSTNTTVEPLTMLLGLLAGGALSHHFSRTTVQQLAMDDASQGQFTVEPMLVAARLLAELEPAVIAWNGTSGSWLGLAHDRAIADAVTAQTGIRATTTTLAMHEAFRRFGWTKIGVVCPYNDELTTAIVREYAHCGLAAVATSNLGLASSLEMGKTPAATIREQLVAVAQAKPDCIAVVCTNLSAIPLTAAFEAEYGIPIVDSVAATFVEVTRLAGRDVAIDGLGRLLSGG